MNHLKKISIIISLLFCTGCELIFLKPLELEREFKNHTLKSDAVLYDGDPLHPAYAFLKKGKIIGLEFNENPECGNITKRYFFSNNEEIEKIVVRIDYFSEHCGTPYDSIYVIEPASNKIKIYTASTDGAEIINEKLPAIYNIDINELKKSLENWQNH